MVSAALNTKKKFVTVLKGATKILVTHRENHPYPASLTDNPTIL